MALEPSIADLVPETVPELAQRSWGRGKILTFYLDLDPSSFGTAAAKKSQIDSLVNESHRLIGEAGDISRDDKESLTGDIAMIRGFLEGDPGWARNAGGIAIFVSSREGLFDVVKLPKSAGSRVLLNDAPFLEPLTDVVPPQGWCVLLVNRRAARIFIGTGNSLEEVDMFEDPVHRKHDQGGWSQARYQRSIEHSVHEHVKHTCDRLFELFKVHSFERLVVGVADELWPEVDRHLHSYLKERLADRIEIEVEHSSVDDVERRLEQIISKQEKRETTAALEAFEQNLSKGRAVAGLDDTLAALNEKRVGHLLFTEGFETPGAICPKCGWTSAAAGTCSLDGAGLEEVENIVERVIEMTYLQGGDVRAVGNDSQLKARGSIAALLRF